MLVELLEMFQPIEYANYSFNRYTEETDNFGQRAYINAVSILDTSFRHYLRDNLETAYQLLNEAIQASITARRFHFWCLRYPNIAIDLDSAESEFEMMSEEEINARMHFSKNQEVNEYIRDIWYSISEEVE